MAARPDLIRAAARYETIALCLQGGGALGSYQGGAYEALDAAGIRPDWVAGISIGAINAAIIAGNPPEDRVARLRAFWERVSIATGLPDVPLPFAAASFFGDLAARSLAGFWNSSLTVLKGQSGFFQPRVPPPWARARGADGADSYYDTAPLRDTLNDLVDWQRIAKGDVRLSVGAVNVETGNFRWFDSRVDRIGPEHIMASGALPPAFAAVPVRGAGRFWDGGLVSNTPLEHVLDGSPRKDTLAFQVDLWSARGQRPADLLDVFERQKDIQYSSRTRAGTDRFARDQMLRHRVAAALAALPPGQRRRAPFAALADHGCDKVMNVVHLIYQGKAHQNHAKDYEFSEAAMLEHWRAGAADVVRTLRIPRVFARPRKGQPVITHDVHRRDPRER